MLRSYVLVFIQLACIIFIILTGDILPSEIFLLIPGIVFVIISFLSMAEMKFRFNIVPELLENSSLVTSGPFKYVRHPIYTSIIFMILILVINDFTFLRFGVWIILVIVLNIKLNSEEKILAREFPDYIVYKSKSKKLIPFIY